MRHLLILTCLLFGAGVVAAEADFDFKSLGAKKALRDYKKAVAKDEKAQAQKQKELDEAGAKAAKTTRDAFAERLKKSLKQAMQAGNLEEANKIDAAIKALKKGSPAGGPAADRKEQADRTTQVEYWPNGQKKLEGHFKDGNPDGLWTMWDETGRKVNDRHWKDGKKDGLETQWHENGRKENMGHNKNDEEEGLWTHWYENGQKKSEAYFKNGKLDGLVTEWYDNGKKKVKIQYKDGEEVSRRNFR